MRIWCFTLIKLRVVSDFEMNKGFDGMCSILKSVVFLGDF